MESSQGIPIGQVGLSQIRLNKSSPDQTSANQLSIVQVGLNQLAPFLGLYWKYFDFK